MDDNTKEIISQVSGVLIQSLFSYLAQAGMSPSEIDVLFAKQRDEFRRKKPSTLPSPE